VSPAVTTQRLARWSRLGAIVAIPLMGATLLVVVWSTVRSIDSASQTTIRGEANTLRSALLAELFGPGDAPPEARLAGAFEARAADGLRYVALVDADGGIVAEAGTATRAAAVLERWVAAVRPGEPERIDGLVRVIYRRVRRPDAPERTSTRPPRPGILIELEPRVADQLGVTARRLLVVGTLAALTLTVLAAVLVRWSLRREHAVRAVEQARRLATLGHMSAVLAHEIRNPLASLKGNAQLLAHALPEGDRARAKADRVVSEASRLETLSNELLEFARDGELRLVEVDPATLLRDAAATAGAARVTVDDRGAPRTWRVDADKLRQVLINLVDNAAAIADGPIEARVAREERSLLIAIRDHGPGIPDADLPHVFEPFFTRRTRGTGLGLAVAKRLVELHGGTIAASNAPGGGAEVRVTLPRR
jgi:two-component system, NtrC family, sensor histidine kinase HydH